MYRERDISFAWQQYKQNNTKIIYWTHNVFFQSKSNDGTFLWSTSEQGYVLSSFFYGYVITQIPFGILSKKYGAKYFLGVGMLINSVFGFLVPWSANFGILSLITIRFIQGLGEVSIVFFFFENYLFILMLNGSKLKITII